MSFIYILVNFLRFFFLVRCLELLAHMNCIFLRLNTCPHVVFQTVYQPISLLLVCENPVFLHLPQL